MTGPDTSGRSSTAPVTLMYHALEAAPPDVRRDERWMFVPPRTFSQQMALLDRYGYRTFRLDEFAAALEGRTSARKRILLTFDDAYAHIEEAATEALRRHGFTAVIFAPWSHLGQRNTWDQGSSPALSRLQILSGTELRALERGPWEVASHGSRHVDLRRLAPPARIRELREAREGLAEVLGHEVVDLAYPFGACDPAVRAAASQAGYRMAFTARGDAPGGRLELPRRAIGPGDAGLKFRLKSARGAGWIYRVKGPVIRRLVKEPTHPADVPARAPQA